MFIIFLSLNLGYFFLHIVSNMLCSIFMVSTLYLNIFLHLTTNKANSKLYNACGYFWFLTCFLVNKGRIYGTGQLVGGSSSLKPQSSASTSSVEEVTYLKQQLQETNQKLKVIDQWLQENDQAYAKLKGQFQSLQNIFLTLLPPDQQVLR